MALYLKFNKNITKKSRRAPTDVIKQWREKVKAKESLDVGEWLLPHLESLVADVRRDLELERSFEAIRQKSVSKHIHRIQIQHDDEEPPTVRTPGR